LAAAAASGSPSEEVVAAAADAGRAGAVLGSTGSDISKTRRPLIRLERIFAPCFSIKSTADPSIRIAITFRGGEGELPIEMPSGSRITTWSPS
jgi:hypothetical protein